MSQKKQSICIKTALAVAALAGWCLFQFWRMWSAFPPDLSALYMAGYLHAEGMYDLIYARPSGFFGGTPREWWGILPRLGLSGENVLPYVYPPLWAGLLSPIAGALSPEAFFRGALLIQIPMIAASVVLAWRILRPTSLPLWAWIMISVGLLSTSMLSKFAVVQLQPQITVIFLILLSFERYGAGKAQMAGAILAIAAALKLAPVVLAVIFVMDRNWTAFRMCALVGVCLAAVSVTLMGPQLHFAFLDSVRSLSDGVFITSVNYSVNAMLHGIGIEMGFFQTWVDLNTRNIRLNSSEVLVDRLCLALLAFSLIAVLWRTRAMSERTRLTVRIFAIAGLFSLFGPLGWAHYFVLQMLLVPAMIPILGARSGGLILLVFGLMTSVPAFNMLRSAYSSDLPVMAASTIMMLLTIWAITSRPHARPRRMPKPTPAQ
ncbi:glycosyltransferase family 87 protein [Actibacterium mucosum]|nr:glycosyltransferase family 87 protein [Actibacterium mucosum]